MQPETQHLGCISRTPETSAPDQTNDKKRKARDSNPHHLSVSRISNAARQTVSGYLPCFIVAFRSIKSDFKWSTGESNPDLLYAKQMSSRWTSTPFHFLLQHAPKDSNPDILGWNQQCYRYTKGVQFFVFVCLNLTSIAIQNFSGNARNRTSRQLPHN